MKINPDHPSVSKAIKNSTKNAKNWSEYQKK